MTKNHGNQIKNDETYEALREDGASKEKAARIANAQANSDQNLSEKGGKSSQYEDQTVDDLKDKAKDIGIKG